MDAEFDSIARYASPPVQDLMRQTRALLSDIYPAVVEIPWVCQKTIGYGIGPKKMSEHFCWIGIYESHIVLGFNYGATLLDPHGLLEGTGKAFRHYKIRTPKDLQHPGLEPLIRRAIQDIKFRNG